MQTLRCAPITQRRPTPYYYARRIAPRRVDRRLSVVLLYDLVKLAIHSERALNRVGIGREAIRRYLGKVIKKAPQPQKCVQMVAFRCYSPSGTKKRGFHVWYDGLSPDFRSVVDVELELASRDKTLEESGRFKALRGKCRGLTEILIDFEIEPDVGTKREEVHIRILGFGTAEDFVLLFGFRKRGGPDYGPACRSAHNRKRGVKRDGRRARPCRFP